MDIQQLESSVIGGLLLNGASQMSFDVISSLSDECFSIPLYRKYYIEIKNQALTKNLIDMVLISDKFSGNDSANLFESAKNCPCPSNLKGYANLLKESHQSRAIISLIEQTQKDLTHTINFEQKQEVISDLVKKITLIETSKDDIEPIHISSVVHNIVETLENRMDGKEKVINFSLPDLDKKLGGLEPTDLIILAGRPSMGKTELALEAIKKMAMKGQGVLVFSLEMSANQLAQRQVASSGNIATGKFRNPADLESSEWGQITKGIHEIANLPIWMVDICDLTIDKIRNIARRHKQKHPELTAIFIDYLGLIKPPKAERLDIAIGIISRELKSMAKELKTPVIALSQLSRKVEERTNKRPLNSDLRNSGEIEQDADITLFLYRDEYYNPESQHKGIAEIIVGKARNGERGTVYMGFVNGHFKSLEPVKIKELENYKPVKQRTYAKAPF